MNSRLRGHKLSIFHSKKGREIGRTPYTVEGFERNSYTELNWTLTEF